MAFSSEMRKLAQNLQKDYGARMAAVTGIRANVHQELSDFHSARQTMTAEQQQQLNNYMEALHGEVAEANRITAVLLKEINAASQAMTSRQRHELDEYIIGLRRQVTETSHATAILLKEIASNHQAMFDGQQQWLDEQMKGLRQQVGDLLQGAASFLGDLDSANQAMAKEQKQKLEEQHSHLVADTEEFRTNLTTSHKAMMQEQEERLSEHIDNLRHAVRDLRSDTAAFLKNLQNIRQSMAAEQQFDLGEQMEKLHKDVGAMRLEQKTFMNDLHTTQSTIFAEQRQRMENKHTSTIENVALLLHGFQDERNALQADLNEARLVWNSFRTLKQHTFQKKIAASATPAKQIPEEKPKPQPKRAVAEDLTAIHGIGQGFAKRLNEAGISTYASLATSTPEQIREILGKMARLAKVETWITQARNMTR
jgi:predicted flap endonuclease-1-like 5' DNA nuclease